MTLSFRSYHLDGTLAGHPTKGIREYQQEHTEGPFVASFALVSGEADVNDDGLRAWFENKLMTEISVMSEGVVAWRGFIYEMTLEMGGEVRTKSIEDMTNACKTRYTNTDGDVVHTGWKTNSESIVRYGHKEKIVTSASSKLEEAEERAEVELQYHASPYTTAVAYRETAEHRLSVTCVGRVVLANHIQLVTDTMRVIALISDPTDPLYNYSGTDSDWAPATERPGDPGDTITVGNEIRRLVEVINYNGGWLYALDIAANDTETAVGVSSNIGAFDRIRELAKLRNSDGEFYRLQVTMDGGVSYRKFNEDVNYLRYRAPRGLESLDGSKPTWTARPGIIKYVDVYAGASLPDTWLSDRRLSFAERVVMRDGDKVATFHGRDLDATDIYRAVEANQRWIEANKAPPVAKTATEAAAKRDIYGHTIQS